MMILVLIYKLTMMEIKPKLFPLKQKNNKSDV